MLIVLIIAIFCIKNINEEKNSHQTNLFAQSENENENEVFKFEQSVSWKQKELLAEEFKSIGFYLTDHPLNNYEEIFNQLNIKTYNEFYNNKEKECLIAGTIMSIQEKKSAKGTPYAIIKFSDKDSEFELFLFAELLISNRAILKESESFVLTLQKDNNFEDNVKKRVNIRKIINLDDLIKKPYSKVIIELNSNFNLDEIKNMLSITGETKVEYSLEENRKFDLNHLKALKAKNYVEKIIV